jgi:hypothetical protein
MKQHPTKIAPTSDDRNKIVTVWDTYGNPFQHTNTNARELVRHLNFTLDSKEAERRRGAPAKEVVLANDGTTTASQLAQEKLSDPVEVPVWEDVTAVPVEILRKAAAYFKVKDLDARWGAKRIIAALESALDQTLSASGDFDGPEPITDTSTDEERAAANAAGIARRRRSYALAAISAGVAFGEQTSIAQLLTSVAALVQEQNQE